MKPRRKWAEIKADFERLVKTMNGEELEEADWIMLGRIASLNMKLSAEIAKTFKVGEEVRYFSMRGGPYAPKEPDIRGVVERIDLESGYLRIRREDGETALKLAMDVRKIVKDAENDLKD